MHKYKYEARETGNAAGPWSWCVERVVLKSVIPSGKCLQESSEEVARERIALCECASVACAISDLLNLNTKKAEELARAHV